MNVRTAGIRVLAAAALVAGIGCSNTTEPVLLNTPTGLAVSQLSLTSARVTWTAVTGAAAYRLERASATAPGVFTQVGGAIGGTEYDDTGLTAGIAYSYRVAATSGAEASAYTAPVTITLGLAARTIAGNISANRTLYADTVYTLSGYVKVQAGATLTIQPGTRIEGAGNIPGSSLWILRGAKLMADGTVDKPIVFTSAKPVGQRKPGDWGGIILIGNGIINRTGAVINTEGGAAGIAENYAGGTNNADNSGSLKYVRIEFAGYDISNGAGQELNSLSMYAVGSGTRIEYVQSMSGLDDSFEWWGGAVDARYLVSYESGDDHFDWTEGFAGRVQFLVGLQTQRLDPAPGTGVFSSDPRGFEGDGCDPVPGSGCFVNNAPADPAGTSAPYSRPVFANFTLVGPGPVGGFPGDGNGAVMRRGTGGTLTNGILGRWPGKGIEWRDAFTDSLRLRDSLNIVNVILVENGPAAAPTHYDAAGDATRFAQQAKFVGMNHRTGNAISPIITSLNVAALDWTPRAGGAGDPDPTIGGSAVVPARLAARVAGYPYSGGWVNTTYVGAAPPGGPKWWDGWTVYTVN